MESDIEKNEERGGTLVKWLVLLVFAGLTVVFCLAPASTDVPLPEPVSISSQQIDPSPLRQLLGDPPVAKVNHYERSCQDCHQIFESKVEPDKKMIQHDNIVMDHGSNKQCYNCHYREDRNLLVLRTGERISFNKVEQLCAQCHGTTYRDWQKGMHGKTLGYWNATKGESHRLRCSECHDPHSPAFDSFEPLPQPNTLRMGQKPEGAHGIQGTKNPLRTWSRESTDHDEQEH